MKYRSRTDIICMVLQGAMRGATKTRLMYSSYLSYAQIQEYIEFLTRRGLIALQPGSTEYKLTEQGLHFLRTYDEISQIVSLDGTKASNRFLPQVFA